MRSTAMLAVMPSDAGVGKELHISMARDVFFLLWSCGRGSQYGMLGVMMAHDSIYIQAS
jgi:hypothetical protein